MSRVLNLKFKYTWEFSKTYSVRVIRRFVFGTIRKSADYTPRTFFPDKYHTDGGCIVDIQISDFPWEHCSPDQGKWQVAHECVHLLDPGIVGTANYLEEGLAAWFQDESRFHDDTVRQYIARNTTTGLYALTRDHVLCCMPQLTRAVKEIRASGKRTREISPDVLDGRLPQIDWKTIESLCVTFQTLTQLDQAGFVTT